MKKRLLAAVAVAGLAALGASPSLPSPGAAALTQYVPVCGPVVRATPTCRFSFGMEPYQLPWLPFATWEEILAL